MKTKSKRNKPVVKSAAGVKFLARGGKGRPHRFESVLALIVGLKKGELIRVPASSIGAQRTQVALSQGIRRRGLRHGKDGTIVRVRTSTDGDVCVVRE